MVGQIKNNKINRILIYLVFILVVIWLLVVLGIKIMATKDKKTVALVGQEVEVVLAKTPEQKSLGLGRLDVLAPNTGMLFVYDNYIIPSFWMKDMRFSIDIIWIKNDTVIGYEKSVKPQTSNDNLPTYQPKSFINYVLEVNSGFVDKYGLLIGDEVKIDI